MKKEMQQRLAESYKNQPLFSQAVTEFLESVLPYLEAENATEEAYALLERMMVPERVIAFKVVWEDDKQQQQYNTGYRVQFNSALGPYKGGLRFDTSVTEDTLKFLGFEQIFKNSLTGLPLGGGKGGSDFNPKGKSDAEIKRFCTAFMTALYRYIGPYTDVPAGDIGVGGREVGYLYGAYKNITNKSDGVLTGKGVSYNGSNIRTEATGYGVVYFVKEMLLQNKKDLNGLRAVVSGSGNVATYAADKLVEEGAKVLTLSDRGGYVYAEDGLSLETVSCVKDLKKDGGSLKDMKLPEGVLYQEGKPWHGVKADVYLPCATQNEIDLEDAKAIAAHGAIVVAEGANMPLSLDAVHFIKDTHVLFGPAKAVNAGGVAVSGLEMSQNAGHAKWTRKDVDERLREIMKGIHETCVEYGAGADGVVDYQKGANIGGFVRVFSAMEQLGY